LAFEDSAVMTLKRGARFLPASLLFLACKPPMHVTPVPAADVQIQQSGGAQAVKPGGPVIAGVGLGVATSDLLTDKPAGQVMVGVGDIASCTQKLGLATAMLVDSIIKSDSVADVPTTTFTLGDNVYSSGSEAQFAQCFTPSWGNPKLEVMKNLHPTPGNHDYETPQAAPYFKYFGKAAGVDGTGNYSYDVGKWHVIALNSEVVAGSEFSDADRSAQLNWLEKDLGDHEAACTIAYWHNPRYSSGWHGNDAKFTPLWQTLYDHNVDLDDSRGRTRHDEGDHGDCCRHGRRGASRIQQPEPQLRVSRRGSRRRLDAHARRRRVAVEVRRGRRPSLGQGKRQVPLRANSPGLEAIAARLRL
jgi:hypothetical protein